MSRSLTLALVALALVAGSAVAGGAGSAYGQAATNAQAKVTPEGEHDPGSTITVANATDTPRDLCTGGSPGERTISVDVLTSSDRLVSGPHTAAVGSFDGRWSVAIPLASDLAPGAYKALASCYDRDNTKVRNYDPAPFTVRLQNPGSPAVQPTQAAPGDPVQIGSGPAKCKPPKGSPSPKVRASILDNGGNTRAEGENQVLADGSWSVTLRVPGEMLPQDGSVTAQCMARVGAPAPYARYGQTRLTVVAAPPPSTTSTAPPVATTLAPGQTAPPSTVPAPTTTLGPIPKLPGFTQALPPTPLAEPIVAEPTYTG